MNAIELGRADATLLWWLVSETPEGVYEGVQSVPLRGVVR
jgi:hypothetical protein